MNDPKYQPGQEVEAMWNGWGAYENAVVKTVIHMYIVEFPNHGNVTLNVYESQVRLPAPPQEEAWEKATMLIAFRAAERRGWNYTSGAIDEFNKETRHQVYQTLGSAGIKITAEVKSDVRRLIQVADSCC